MKTKILALLLCGLQFAYSKNKEAPQMLPFRAGPYLQFQAGVSFSMKADVKIRTPPWDAAPQGYTSSMGTSPLYGIAFGYQFLRLVRSDISVEYRPSYSYKKFQSGGPLDAKTREFDVSNVSFLLNGYLSFDPFWDKFSLSSCQLIISPFIGAGLGIAFNQMRSFHSVSNSMPPRVFSMMTPRLTTYLAAQASAGLDFKLPHWAVGFGYRFFYGGRFKSENYLLDNPSGIPNLEAGRTKEWKAHLLANEIFCTLRYHF